MPLRIVMSLLLAFYLLVSPGLAKEKAGRIPFDARAALGYIQELTSDDAAGREDWTTLLFSPRACPDSPS